MNIDLPNNNTETMIRHPHDSISTISSCDQTEPINPPISKSVDKEPAKKVKPRRKKKKTSYTDMMNEITQSRMSDDEKRKIHLKSISNANGNGIFNKIDRI